MRDTTFEVLTLIGGPLIVVMLGGGVFLYTSAGIQSARARQEAGHLRDVLPTPRAVRPKLAISFTSKPSRPARRHAVTCGPGSCFRMTRETTLQETRRRG